MPVTDTVVRPRRRFLVALLVCMLAAASYWAVSNCWSAGVSDVASDDLAHAWQTVWNVGHGFGFQHSHIPLHHNAPRLATHADYLLILLAPLAWIWPNYQVLLVVQAALVALGAWYVWRIGWLLLRDDVMAFVVAVSYLLAGMVVFPVIWQFHAVTLAIPFGLAMAEAIIARRRAWVVALWLGLALMTKEQVGFIFGPLALYLGWVGQRKKLGWWLGSAGVIYSLIHYLYILPHFAPTEVPHPFWQFYFGSLGTTPGEIIPKLLQPGEIWHRLSRVSVQTGALGLIIPFAILPFFQPVAFLAVLAEFPHWLADPTSVNGIYAQNHVLAVPIVFLAVLLVLRRWQRRRWWATARQPLVLLLVVFGVLGSCLFSPYPWSVLYAPIHTSRDPDLPTLQRLNRTIPATAIVGYSWGIPPIFVNRQTAHVLPYGLEEIDYAVVHPSKNPNLQRLVGSYDDQLFSYFDRSSAFETVFRSPTVGVYRRVRSKTPAALPSDFVDQTPSWTGHCQPDCLQRQDGG